MAQPDYSGSAMIALYPDAATAAALLLPGGLGPDELHLTVAYVGDAADTDPAALAAVAKLLAERGPVAAQIGGSARFTGGENDVLVALADSPSIEDLRRDCLDRCAENGVNVPREHGYTAHLTRQYVPAGAPDPGRLTPFQATFSAVSAVHGDTRTDFPFTSPRAESIADLARSAYATGWARSGGPLTDRVKAGCAAAMDLACQHPGDRGILEVTLKLGSLEGMWAKLYERREHLIASSTAKATTAWKRALTREQIAWAVDDYRKRTGLAEANEDEKARDKRILADAMAAATAMLALLPGRPSWQLLRTEIRDALAAGQAEGIVGAVAIAAEQIERVGLDWDLAFEDALRNLNNLQSLWGNVDSWLAKMLGRATADLGRALAQATREGKSYPDMLADAMAALDDDNVSAVSFVVDWATTAALRQGALDLYSSEGVSLVSWMDAGDDRVCPACESNAENGPYAPADYPDLPHPLCRCCSAAALDLANFDSWFIGV